MVASMSPIVGAKFGYLTVIARGFRLDSGGWRKYWLCRCECGVEKEVHAVALRQGSTKSCGCKRSEMLSLALRKHGQTHTPIYQVWRSMVRRCHDNKHTAYPDYGQRGITVCERWRESFEAFVSDMGSPLDGLTLERRDNDGNYGPDNCYWATRKQQANNRRSCRYLTHDGITLTVAAWGERTGFGENVLRARLRSGWSVERTLTEPVHKKGA